MAIRIKTHSVWARAESKVPCTRVRYVSDLGYVSKTQTRYTPSYDSQCNTLPVILKKGNFAGSRCKWEFLRIFRRFRQVLERCVTRAPIARANILEFFFMKTAKFSNFRSGRGTFPITSPSADAYLYKGTHCVSGFRDYVSEGGTDTYPIFWRRFSSSDKPLEICYWNWTNNLTACPTPENYKP